MAADDWSELDRLLDEQDELADRERTAAEEDQREQTSFHERFAEKAPLIRAQLDAVALRITERGHEGSVGEGTSKGEPWVGMTVVPSRLKIRAAADKPRIDFRADSKMLIVNVVAGTMNAPEHIGNLKLEDLTAERIHEFVEDGVRRAFLLAGGST